MVAVWDPLVRLTHWSVALLVFGNFVNESGSRTWHRYAGYACVVLVLARMLWGRVGNGHARFSRWRPTISGVSVYLRVMLAGNPPRYLGHNPLGACMVLLLWALLIGLGCTGWMMGLDAFWGDEWLQDLHEVLAYTLLGCVAIHVSAAVAMSIRHRENLVKAMLTGKKRAP